SAPSPLDLSAGRGHRRGVPPGLGGCRDARDGRPWSSIRRALGFRMMAHGTHDFDDDPRNERILIWVNGELVPRERAVVSVFDAGFVLGDGVWEGLRVRAG